MALKKKSLGNIDLIRSWKGYYFDNLDRLDEKGLIDKRSNKSKSVYLTDEGVVDAKKLCKKYLGEEL